MAKKTIGAGIRDRAAIAARNGFLFASTTIQSIDESEEDISETVREEVRHAMHLAQELESACGTDQELKAALTDIVGMDLAGVSIILSALNSTGMIVGAGVLALAKVPVPDISTFRLSEALAAYRESAECRREIRKNLTDGLPQSLKPGAPFYPFLEYMRLEGGAAFKAEALARISLYVDSDHAENDLVGPLPETEPDRQAVLDLRDLFARMRADEVVPPTEIKSVIDSVLNLRLVRIQVRSAENAEGGHVHLATEPVGKGGQLQMDDGKPMGAGFIDVAIRNAYDPSKWLIGVVTSMDTSERQGDQLARHANAVLEAIEREMAPFSSADTLAAIQFFSSALVYSDQSDSRQLSGKLVESLGELSRDERAQINALTQISILDSIRKPLEAPPALVLLADHMVYGAQSSHIGGMGRSVPSAVNLASKNVAAVLSLLVERGSKLRNHSGPEERVFQSTLRAARGLCASFANQTEALAPLLDARHLVEKIAQARAARGWDEDDWFDLADKMSAESLEKKAKRQSVSQAALMPGREETLDKHGKATLASMPNEKKMAAHIQRLVESGDLHPEADRSRIASMRSAAANASARFTDALIAEHVTPSALWQTKHNGRPLRQLSFVALNEWLDQHLTAKGVALPAQETNAPAVDAQQPRSRGKRNGAH